MGQEIGIRNGGGLPNLQKTQWQYHLTGTAMELTFKEPNNNITWEGFPWDTKEKEAEAGHIINEDIMWKMTWKNPSLISIS